jgi:DME family drug/metabolite transporter
VSPGRARPAHPGTGGTAAILLAGGLFGTAGTAMALGPDGASPASVAMIRLVVGGGLLVALLGRRRWPWRRAGARPWGVVAAGMAGIAVYQLAFFAAVDRAGVAIGTVVAIGAAPLITGALGAALRRDRLGLRWAVATAAAVAGCALVLLPAGRGGGSALGVGLALVAAAGYSVYTLCIKALLERGWGAGETVAVLLAGAALATVPVGVASAGWVASWSGVALAVYLGVFATAIAQALFARGLRTLSPARVTTLMLAEPLAGALLGTALLGQPLTAAAVAGCVLILAGLALVAREGDGPAPEAAARLAAARTTGV